MTKDSYYNSGNVLTTSGGICCSGYIEISTNLVDLSTSDGFYGCTELLSVVFPSSLTAISGYRLFERCSKLSSVNLPTSLVVISNDYTFRTCTSVTSVVFPTSLTSLPGNYLFLECTGLLSVVLPTSLTTITGSYHFYDCTGLSVVVFPTSLTAITGSQIFLRASSSMSIYLPTSLAVLAATTFGAPGDIPCGGAGPQYPTFYAPVTLSASVYSAAKANCGVVPLTFSPTETPSVSPTVFVQRGEFSSSIVIIVCLLVGVINMSDCLY